MRVRAAGTVISHHLLKPDRGHGTYGMEGLFSKRHEFFDRNLVYDFFPPRIIEPGVLHLIDSQGTRSIPRLSLLGISIVLQRHKIVVEQSRQSSIGLEPLVS